MMTILLIAEPSSP